MQVEQPHARPEGAVRRLLIVEDDRDFADSLVDILAPRGYTIEVTHSANSACEAIQTFEAHVVLLDIRLGHDNGIDLIARLHAIRPDVLCVMITAHVTIESAIQALQEGAYDYLRKPFSAPDLLATLDRGFEKLRLEHEKQALEAQLRQAQKMRAIGTLAGGIAHDFNNLLTGILGYASLLKLKAQPGDNVFRVADAIEKIASRSAQLTEQLLGFAYQGKYRNLAIDLHTTIQDVISLLRRTSDQAISLRPHLGARHAVVLGDPGQMQQVILNLAVNARDAMPEGGELRIETDVIEVDDNSGRWRADLTPGPYLRVSVTDTGCGIDQEVQERIFEPFFTTKAPGGGTGMGLAMVYGIVKNHGGAIHVSSAVGQGSTFRVYLPLAAETAVAVAAESGSLVRGAGRILIVDDEADVRDVATDLLGFLGYEVVTAADGQEAVDYYRQWGDALDLVVIDMVMPRMNGRDCFRALKALDPHVRAILSTGYDLNDAVQGVLDEGIHDFVQKPYEVHRLSEVVARTLQT